MTQTASTRLPSLTAAFASGPVANWSRPRLSSAAARVSTGGVFGVFGGTPTSSSAADDEAGELTS